MDLPAHVDNPDMGHWRLLVLTAVTAGLVGAGAAPALAFDFTGPLQQGDVSTEVGELEERIAGWFPKIDQTLFVIDHKYDAQTRWAIVKLQKHYGLDPDGIAGPEVFAVLDRLEQNDGSTKHFDFSEFWQKSTDGCGKRANKYAETFDGGAVPVHVVKRNVRNLMWRLEAVRAKGGGNPIGVNSGFRSVPYNDCLGGASLSQHTYGTAADVRMAEISNRKQRDIARGSQMHGIGCYSSLKHNHFDLRIQNEQLPEVSSWWWPEQDRYERDLADDNAPCWGETKHTLARSISTVDEIAAWEAAGEVPLNGAD